MQILSMVASVRLSTIDWFFAGPSCSPRCASTTVFYADSPPRRPGALHPGDCAGCRRTLCCRPVGEGGIPRRRLPRGSPGWGAGCHRLYLAGYCICNNGHYMATQTFSDNLCLKDHFCQFQYAVVLLTLPLTCQYPVMLHFSAQPFPRSELF